METQLTSITEQVIPVSQWQPEAFVRSFRGWIQIPTLLANASLRNLDQLVRSQNEYLKPQLAQSISTITVVPSRVSSLQLDRISDGRVEYHGWPVELVRACPDSLR